MFVNARQRCRQRHNTEHKMFLINSSAEGQANTSFCERELFRSDGRRAAVRGSATRLMRPDSEAQVRFSFSLLLVFNGVNSASEGTHVDGCPCAGFDHSSNLCCFLCVFYRQKYKITSQR